MARPSNATRAARIRAALHALLLALLLPPVLAAPPEADFAALRAWLAEHAGAPADGLAPGVYDREALSDLAYYLPPGYLEEFDFPELAFELVETERYEPHRLYQDATARFAGQARLAADGNLQDYVAGMPFAVPRIERASADEAGFMVAWNHIHRWEFFGFSAPETTIAFISPTPDGAPRNVIEGMEGGGNVDRHLSMSYRRTYLSKLAPLPDQEYRLDVEGSDALLFKEKIELLEPFDVAGTTLIVERPLDQRAGDLVNSYMPSERRVRRLSPKERADSWMGTHWTLDDFGGFSGLVMDNTWSFLGRKVIPYVADSRHEKVVLHGPISVVPLDRWQLRPCFVVTAVPRWEGHPYGRRVLFIDEETWSVGLVLVYDRNDELMKVISGVYERTPAGSADEPGLTTARMRASIVVNVADHTANVARVIKPTTYAAVKPSQIRRIFSVADLNGGR